MLKVFDAWQPSWKWPGLISIIIQLVLGRNTSRGAQASQFIFWRLPVYYRYVFYWPKLALNVNWLKNGGFCGLACLVVEEGVLLLQIISWNLTTFDVEPAQVALVELATSILLLWVEKEIRWVWQDYIVAGLPSLRHRMRLKVSVPSNLHCFFPLDFPWLTIFNQWRFFWAFWNEYLIMAVNKQLPRVKYFGSFFWIAHYLLQLRVFAALD